MASVKKWWPEMIRLVGPMRVFSCVVRLNCNASFGRIESKSGYVEATQLALKRVATAPTAVGTAVALAVSHV